MANQTPPRLLNNPDAGPADLKWQTIVLSLFEIFKFNYETLGTKPSPVDRADVHASAFLKSLDQKTYFGEKHHVHFNSLMAYGHRPTLYPMDGNSAFPHITLENYQQTWLAPLNLIADWQETFPLVFSTEANYFMESCNSDFLRHDRYLQQQSYPFLRPEIFTSTGFAQLGLPASLLTKSFALPVKLPDKIIRTLNFCLKIFQEMVLIQAALQQLFGPATKPPEQIEFLRRNWLYPEGLLARQLSLPKLNLLSFLYLNMHPFTLVTCYGIYRDKYGAKTDYRTCFYVREQDRIITLKEFLRAQIKAYFQQVNKALNQGQLDLAAARPALAAALDLARMYGLGYQTVGQKKVNIHKNVPQDFTPSQPHPGLSKLNFIVEHSTNSPFWRIFYDYCGEWYSPEVLEQLLVGRGADWERLKTLPRAQAIHVCHQNTALFWQAHLAEKKLPQELAGKISDNYQRLLDRRN